MTDKELRKLNRRELLEILVSQQKEIDRLRSELHQAKEELQDRRIAIEKAGSLAEAVEEMPAGYADKMESVINNTPVLIVMLVLTVPVAILGMRLAEKILKKQASALE